jgi:MFS family permease
LKPTHTRHWVLAIAATLAVVTYIDRVCMSQAKGPVAADLHLTSVQMGYVFAASTLAYGCFGPLGGWMGDKFGPRAVLTRIVILWSLFTAATGWAWNLISLASAQFLFGGAEAGVFPNLAKAFTNWLPASERNRAVSLMWLCSRWGGAITPLLVVWTIRMVGWRWTFGVFAAIGIVWAAIFHWWFRDYPRDHRGFNGAELELLKDAGSKAAGRVQVPWGRILRCRTVWLLVVQYFCFGYGWYFFITWLPSYLNEARHLEPARAAFLAGFPLFFGGFGCILSGLLAAQLVKMLGSVAKSRRALAYFGYAAAAVLFVLAAYIKSPLAAMIVMGFSSFAMDLTLPNTWSTCMDVGGKYAGTVSGSVNMAAQIGCSVSSVIIGYILQYLDHNWLVTFWISGAIFVLGGLCWKWIDPVTPVAVAG